MSVLNARSEYRDLKIEFGETSPIDFYKAAIKRVEKIEHEVNMKGTAGVPDLTSEEIIIVGSLPENTFKCNLTTVQANGEYTVGRLF